MPKKHVVSGPISKFQPKPLDLDMFFELFDILHDSCMEGNYTATARVLGISPQTARKWSKNPPIGPWWNHVLHFAISEVYQSMSRSKHKKIRKRAERVSGALHRSSLHLLKDYVEFNEANNSDVQRALLIAVNESPTQSLSSDELRKPGVLGAYSQRAVREAAVQLQLIMESKGYGKDKVAVYRMPTSED